MKPEDFTPKHTKSERLCYIDDHVWFIPYGRFPAANNFTFPGWNHPDFFGNDNPVNLEYCSGNGAWIAAKAQAHPEINWVGVEMKFDRVRKIWSKVKNHHLKNLIVICGEALHSTELYFPLHSINEIFINFPDPWPKKRHEKNRLIQDPFVKEMGRILKPNHPFTFVTDDIDYSEWLIETMKRHPEFNSEVPSPYYTHDFSDYGTSYFEELWRSKGKQIRYHRYKSLCQ